MISSGLLSMSRFTQAGRRERESAERLYAACVAAARRPELFESGSVPDTLQGRFEMLTLHLFVLTNRLMHDPGDDPQLATRVSEVFVAEADNAFRDLGVGDVKVPKRVQTLYRSFAGRLTAYREALQVGPTALEDAVRRNVFPDGERAGASAALAAYLSDAVRAVRSTTLADLRDGALSFPDFRRLSERVR